MKRPGLLVVLGALVSPAALAQRAPPAALPWPSAGAADSRSSEAAHKGRGPLAYVALGAAGVSAASGVFFALRNRAATDDWRTATTDAAWNDGRSRAQTAATAATVSWALAAAFAAVGTYLLLTNP